MWVEILLYFEIKSFEENLAFCHGLGIPTIVEPCVLPYILKGLCSMICTRRRTKIFVLSCNRGPLYHLVPLPLDALGCYPYVQFFAIICKYI